MMWIRSVFPGFDVTINTKEEKESMVKVKQLLAVFCVVTLMCFALGCDGGAGGCGGSSSSSSSSGGASDLDRNHAGWQQPNCAACHPQDNHNAGMAPDECAECHGNNGARQYYHLAGQNCRGCHSSGRKDISDSHPEASFPLNACATCHRS